MFDLRRASIAAILATGLALIAGCDDHYRTLWHDQRLPSGATIKVTSFNLAWGVEHDDRDAGKDCLVLEYVCANAAGNDDQRDAEAAEVFELIRPISEQWGLPTAELLAFPSLERKGKYSIYNFVRQPDGSWSKTRAEMKVFSTD